jgi:hypothetical protein
MCPRNRSHFRRLRVIERCRAHALAAQGNDLKGGQRRAGFSPLPQLAADVSSHDGTGSTIVAPTANHDGNESLLPPPYIAPAPLRGPAYPTFSEADCSGGGHE